MQNGRRKEDGNEGGSEEEKKYHDILTRASIYYIELAKN